MSTKLALFGVAVVCFGAMATAHGEASSQAGDKKESDSVLGFEVKDIDGGSVKLGDKYAGKVLLIVNTASKCGYTPQYADLETLYKEYQSQGLEVLAFPSNDFGGQEPGTEAEIKEFCSSKFKVTFPLFSKVTVKGDGKAPLYAFLTDPKTNPDSSGEVKWNFTKFLIGRDGKIIGRFESVVKPTDEARKKAVEKALADKPSGEKQGT